MAVFFFTAQVAWAGNIKTEKVTLVGNGIVEFIPVGYDVSRTPSLILSHEPEKKGEVPENWKLVPQFTMTDGKANASLDVPAGTSLYGGGEVTGPLLRNGQKIKMWNTDNGMYRVDGGSRLYQTHPWVLGVRPRTRRGRAGVRQNAAWSRCGSWLLPVDQSPGGRCGPFPRPGRGTRRG